MCKFYLYFFVLVAPKNESLNDRGIPPTCIVKSHQIIFTLEETWHVCYHMKVLIMQKWPRFKTICYYWWNCMQILSIFLKNLFEHVKGRSTIYTDWWQECKSVGLEKVTSALLWVISYNFHWFKNWCSRSKCWMNVRLC